MRKKKLCTLFAFAVNHREMKHNLRMKVLEHLQENRSKYYIAVLILATVVILAKGINDGDFWSSDASRHAMDGVFMMDFIKDFPITNIYDYVAQYYTKYPALGIGYYPPFFALVESLFYSIFGISVFSARLTILFFALIAVLFWFRLVKLIYSEKVAFYSSFLFITTPFIVTWSKEVMLEMPTLAMIILSIYSFYNFIELNKPRHGFYLILATVAAVYTKQTAIFLIPLFFLYIIFTKKYKMLLRKDIILINLAIFLLVLPLAAITLKFGNVNLVQSVGSITDQSQLLYAEQWYLYPKFLFRIITLPVLILSIISIFLIFIRNVRQRSILFLSWILGFYLTFTYLSEKVPRYAYFWIPPIVLFATLAINKIPWKIKKISIATILLFPLCCYQFILSCNLNNPFICGYDDAARYILKKQEASVFFHGSGIGTGDFVFNIRKFDTYRKMVVFRGDKLLVSSALNPDWMLVEHVRNKNEVNAVLEAYGVRYFIIEKNAHYDIRALKMLRDVLESDNFTLVKKIKISTDMNSLKDESILIYKLNKATSLKRDFIHMRLPIIGSEITVPLKTLSDFYTPSESIIR